MDKIKPNEQKPMIKLYAVYERFTFDSKTKMGWKWKHEKRYCMKIVTKRELRCLY